MFKDRKHAALILAEKLKKYSGSEGVVLAIPRGGVVLGYELSNILKLPLEIMFTQKIGHPMSKEFSIGSVSLFGSVFSYKSGIDPEYIKKEIQKARENLTRKYNLFMSGRKPIDFKDKTVIIVDDGIATGNTMLSIIQMLLNSKPAEIVIAVPVASESAIKTISSNADVIFYCLIVPENFYAVSQVYENFEQVSDDEVIQLLKEANSREKDIAGIN